MIDEILTLTKRLMTVQSTQENPIALREVLEIAAGSLNSYAGEKFDRHGFPSMLIHNGNAKNNKFKVILNAHLDVVPGKKAQYQPLIKDNRLYGRGSYDMKTAAAAMVYVFHELAHSLPYALALQLVTDEEIGGFDGVKHQIEKGIMTDFIIAGEPTDFLINNKMKGVIWLQIVTKGKTAHASHPWHGENAIAKMNSILNTLHAHYPVPDDVQWVTTMNIACIESTNKTYNKIPDECFVGLDIRFIPEDSGKILDRIKRLLPQGTDLKLIVNEPAVFTEGSNTYVTHLRRATAKIRGKPSPLNHQHFGSDIRHYTAVGAGGVTFGPTGAGLHTDEEWVDIKSVEEYYLILKSFLQNID